MTQLDDLAALGQSIWLDYIRRSFLESGEFAALVQDGVRGVTSNPAIFAAAIGGSSDYDSALAELASQGLSTVEIYETLAIADIRQAADLLRPVFDRTAGGDGFVSLEVSPDLADDTDGTIAEARRLFRKVARPNVLIKVPATPAGIPAIQTLIGDGININITLMFSLAHYDAVAEAYLRGLERLSSAGGDLRSVASVASFFLSRIDTKVDAQLAALADPAAGRLKGQTAIANARVTYQRFLKTFSGPRWERLAAQGARVQRVLWASTSTKDPSLPDTHYVDNLIGPDTVNTIPLETLSAFRDHGRIALTIEENLEQALVQLDQLATLGIDLAEITEQLQVEGVEKFLTPFQALLANIEQKVPALQAKPLIETRLGAYQAGVDRALADLRSAQIVSRIWAHDHTVWSPEPAEISNRLGWLHSPADMPAQIGPIHDLAQALQAEGYRHILLLGMGGSSLAPELFQNVFGREQASLDLAVLDSTDPGAVLAYARQLDPAQTLFIVSTKSGGTVETLSFFKYFYNRTVAAVGSAAAGAHFVAITDAGSKLDRLASQYAFRTTFLNDPNIGGRYSALSFFGLVPAGLIGVDLDELLNRAQQMAEHNSGASVEDEAAAHLGVILGELAKQGRDKMTLVASPGLVNFGDWVEQLIAESTGKNGTGILPVVGEPVGPPSVYGPDRLFVHLRLAGDDSQDAALDALAEAGFPLVTIHLTDRYDLGGQFFLWELATAIAGYCLGIQPFDQPNVEAAKVLAREMVATYQATGRLPAGDSAPLTPAALLAFLDQARPGDYLSLQAYVQPTPAVGPALQELRLKLRDRTHLATTSGYGPRFLHSTGQLHKGDAGHGLFIQIVSAADEDAPIPDEAGQPAAAMTFGILKAAQALGDAQALREASRRLIRFEVSGDVPAALRRLASGLV